MVSTKAQVLASEAYGSGCGVSGACGQVWIGTVDVSEGRCYRLVIQRLPMEREVRGGKTDMVNDAICRSLLRQVPCFVHIVCCGQRAG